MPPFVPFRAPQRGPAMRPLCSIPFHSSSPQDSPSHLTPVLLRKSCRNPSGKKKNKQKRHVEFSEREPAFRTICPRELLLRELRIPMRQMHSSRLLEQIKSVSPTRVQSKQNEEAHQPPGGVLPWILLSKSRLNIALWVTEAPSLLRRYCSPQICEGSVCLRTRGNKYISGVMISNIAYFLNNRNEMHHWEWTG